MQEKTIQEYRKDLRYRFLESFTGTTAILFVILLLFLSVTEPVILAVFLIVYSLFITLKSAIHFVYTIRTFRSIFRYESVSWSNFLDILSGDDKNLINQTFLDVSNQYSSSHLWLKEWAGFSREYDYQIENNIFIKPNEIFHTIFVPIYNEDPNLLLESIKKVYESGYDLNKVLILVASEKRTGDVFFNSLQETIDSVSWSQVHTLDVDTSDAFVAKKSIENDIKLIFDSKTLNVIFTRHPDDLPNEIKGKGSNLDWAGRQFSFFADCNNIDPYKTIISVLDCDSGIGHDFLQILTFRFCFTRDRYNAGFQPIPVFTNNYFDSNLISSLVGSGTTSWNFVQGALPDDIHFFANYSVSLFTLRKVDFWVKDLVSEDSLFFDKCFCELDGKFRSIPTYSYFEADIVQSTDLGEELLNQYKQLRRWAWGGVEGMSYLGRRLLMDKKGQKVDLRKKFRILFLEWSGHFFWSTLPVVFTLVVFTPSLFDTNSFNTTYTASSLIFFSRWFSIISYFMVFFNSIMVYYYIYTRFSKRSRSFYWYNYLDLFLQTIMSPLVFVLWCFPPMEAQIRGILGKYLGFWVTPKKIEKKKN